MWGMNFAKCAKCGALSLGDACAVCDRSSDENGWTCEHCGSGPHAEAKQCPTCDLTRGVSYSSERLAFMWKEGAQLRRSMERGNTALTSANSVGNFLRTHCGPHCAKAQECQQRITDLMNCHREYRKKNGKELSTPAVLYLPATTVVSKEIKQPKTFVSFSKGGWLATMYENRNREQTEDSGGTS